MGRGGCFQTGVGPEGSEGAGLMEEPLHSGGHLARRRVEGVDKNREGGTPGTEAEKGHGQRDRERERGKEGGREGEREGGRERGRGGWRGRG